MLWKRIDVHEQTEYRFRDALHVALGVIGWLVPDSETTARITDVEETKEEELPEELKNPYAALERKKISHIELSQSQ